MIACRHLPLVSWCHWHDWPPPSLLPGRLCQMNEKSCCSMKVIKVGQIHLRHKNKGIHFTLCVFVISRVFGKVFQIVWKPDFTYVLKKWKLQRTLGYKSSGCRCKFREPNLKLTSAIRKCAGAYITQLHKGTVTNILHILVPRDRRWSIRIMNAPKLTHVQALITSPNLIWAGLQNPHCNPS